MNTVENILKSLGNVLFGFINSQPSLSKKLNEDVKAKQREPRKPSIADYEAVMRMGTPEYKNLPVATLSAQMAKGIEKYPIFKKNPFLAIAHSILESSGLKNKKAKNGWGWGVKVPSYHPGVETVLQDFMSGVGGRNLEEEKKKFSDPDILHNRMATSGYYKKFRETGDLMDLATTYAPLKDNPGTGGKYYAQNLKNVMGRYQAQLERYMKKKYGDR